MCRMVIVVRDVDELTANMPVISEISRRMGGEAGRLLGVWCDPSAPSVPPDDSGLRRGVGEFRQSFERAGVWAVWRFEPPAEAAASEAGPHHGLISALLARAERPEGRIYIPVFAADQPAEALAAEMDRLTMAFPDRIAGPLYRRDDRTQLSWSLHDA